MNVLLALPPQSSQGPRILKVRRSLQATCLRVTWIPGPPPQTYCIAVPEGGALHLVFSQIPPINITYELHQLAASKIYCALTLHSFNPQVFLEGSSVPGTTLSALCALFH